MATYRADITQDVNPAQADPSSLIRAEQMRGEAMKGVIGLAEMAYKGYRDYTLGQAEQQAESLAQEFFISGQAASSAARQAAQLEGQRPERGSAFAETLLGAQGPEAQDKAAGMLNSFEQEVTRLKNAAMGGMSNEQYVSRIDSITKKAIAKFPGLADQIRERVGQVTGLAGADRWAQMNYIRERFTPPKADGAGKSEQELAMTTIKRIAPYGTFGDEVTLFKLYNENRPEFDKRVRAASEYEATKTQVEAVKNDVAGLQGQSDLQADGMRSTFTAIFGGSLSANVLNSTILDKENVFGTTLDLMAKGENVSVNPAAFKVQIDMHAAQMRTNIEGARREGYAAVDAYVANNPNISDAKRRELYADVDRAADVMLRRYADDKGVGLVAMANIMSAYRDKRLTERVQLVDLAIKHQSAMQNNPMVMAYWAGGEARENLKRSNPYFYSFMENQERQLTSNIIGVRNDIQGATELANVERVMVAAQQSPAAVPVDPMTDRNTTKAAHEALGASAVEVLKKSTLTPVEVNLVSAALSTSTEYGANSQLLAKQWRNLGTKIAALPDADQAVIKDNVSRSVGVSIQSISDIKRVVEEKYGVKLTLGVNDAGEIGVVPQNVSGKQRPSVVGPAYSSSAVQEFMRQAKPMLNNIVYGTSLATMQDPKQAGATYVDLINNNKPYEGFFSLSYKPTSPRGAAGVVQQTTDMQLVDEAIAKMKEADPNLNVDFFRDAFQRATPERQQELIKMLREGNATMGDVSGLD